MINEQNTNYISFRETIDRWNLIDESGLSLVQNLERECCKQWICVEVSEKKVQQPIKFIHWGQTNKIFFRCKKCQTFSIAKFEFKDRWTNEIIA